MTDQIIALVPDYGLLIILVVVSLACLAIPLPASMLVLAAGAFAASDDLQVWQVLLAAFVAFVLGDQFAFWLASRFGPRLLAWIRGKRRLEPVLEKSEALLHRRGRFAVLLSHTILSPTGPYVSYLCGAGGMKWAVFSPVATLAAAIWSSAYVTLGYLFASQLGQVETIVSNFVGVIFALALGFSCLLWLRKSWRLHVQQQSAAASEKQSATRSE